ncbi:MAG: antitoxin [Actinomycetes bacterium]
MRTTLDLDPVVLAQLKERQRREGKTLGALVSELLAPVLASGRTEPRRIRWPAQALGARMDIDDKDALWKVLDG